MAVTVGVGAWLAAHAFELLIAGIIALEAGATGYMLYDYQRGNETPQETPTLGAVTIGAYSVGGYEVTQTTNLLALQKQLLNAASGIYGYTTIKQAETYMGVISSYGSPANAVQNIDSWAAQTQQSLHALGYDVEVNIIKEELLRNSNMWYSFLGADSRYFNEEYVDYMARNIGRTIYPDIDGDIRKAYEKEAQQDVKPPEGKKPSSLKTALVALFTTLTGRIFLDLLGLTMLVGVLLGGLPGALDALTQNPIAMAVIIIALLLLLLIINTLRSPQSKEQQAPKSL